MKVLRLFQNTEFPNLQDDHLTFQFPNDFDWTVQTPGDERKKSFGLRKNKQTKKNDNPATKIYNATQ